MFNKAHSYNKKVFNKKRTFLKLCSAGLMTAITTIIFSANAYAKHCEIEIHYKKNSTNSVTLAGLNEGEIKHIRRNNLRFLKNKKSHKIHAHISRISGSSLKRTVTLNGKNEKKPVTTNYPPNISLYTLKCPVKVAGSPSLGNNIAVPNLSGATSGVVGAIAALGDNALYSSYSQFMASIGSGTAPMILHSRYRNKVVGGVRLSRVRISYSSKIPMMGITDCNRIYLGVRPVYDKLIQGRDLRDNEKKFFIHEVGHTKQCQSKGGRRPYALMWWKQLPTGLQAAGQSINPSQAHDGMPMESNAESFANSHYSEL